jgi:vacuolar protein sorting-associated protein 13A/C
VNTNHLSISALKGEIQLKDVKLKTTAFEELRLPITIKSGSVGTIDIKVSWTKLLSSPIEVCVSDIHVVACQNTNAGVDEEQRPDDGELLARRAALAAQMKLQNEELLSGHEDSSTKSTTATTIINNLRVSFKNIHVRYEHVHHVDRVGSESTAFGIRLEELSIVSTDADRRPIDFSTDAEVVHKELKILNLGIYHDDPRNGSSATHSAPVLHPLVVTAWLSLVRKGAGKNVPRVSISFEMERAHWTIGQDMVCDGMAVMRALAVRNQGPLLKQRPSVGSYRGHYRLWWKYATDTALELVRKRRQDLSWDRMREHIRLAVRYQKLYRRALGVLPLPPLSDAELDELQAIQDTEPINFLNLVQRVTIDRMRTEVKRMLELRVGEARAPKQGFLSRMFVRGSQAEEKTKMTIGGVEIQLSEAEVSSLQAMAANVSEGIGDESEEAGPLTAQVQLSFAGLDVQVVRASKEGCGAGTGAECLVRIALSGGDVSVHKRRQGFLAETRVHDLVVHGLDGHALLSTPGVAGCTHACGVAEHTHV